uniref:Facilitated trehalose transporter Tret1 n=1 Tax=Cacopsylla melanoneura TaxID=428564 RepID=A0A8D8UZF7_9HEMI
MNDGDAAEYGIKRTSSEEALHPLSVPKNRRDSHTASEAAGSFFDLSFTPTEDVGYKTVLPQIIACISAASYHLPVGLVVGYSAILVPQLQQKNTEIPITKEESAWIASAVVLVVPVGALVTGYLVDRLGRVNTLRLGAVPFIVGWLMIAMSHDVSLLLLGRFISGLAMAMGPSPAIVYITEVARPDLRGALICIGPAITSLGMVIVYALGAVLHWRTVAWLALAYVLIPLVASFLWCPESPVWLISKGRGEQALSSLKYLCRNFKDGNKAKRLFLELEKEQEEKRMNSTRENQSIFKRLLKLITMPTAVKPLFLITILFALQQLAGIYITIFYAVQFLEDMGSRMNVYIATVLVGVVRMLFGIFTSQLLRSFGRRSLTMFSGVGMAVCMIVSGYYTQLITQGQIERSLIPVVCILFYVAISVIGMLTIPWTMTAEIFPLEIRGVAQGLTFCLAHILMFFALQYYPWFKDFAGGSAQVQWFFALVSVISVVYVYIFLPETHGRTLLEIEQYFEHSFVYICSKNRKNSKAILQTTESPKIVVSTEPAE